MRLLLLVLVPLFTGLIISLVRDKRIQILGDLTRVYLLIQSCINLYTVASTNNNISIRLIDSGLLGIGLVSDRVSSLLVVTSALLFFIFGIYMRNKKGHNNLFHCLTLIIEGVIMMVFLSIDLFNIFVLIEVSSVICGILIMYLRDKRSVYDGLVYMLLNTLGIMFYLLGVGMMYKIFGNLDIPTIQTQIIDIPRNQLVLPFAFLMCGMAVKSALFPAYLWLPKAHGTPGAPSTVSAILSGIYIKSSLYALIRLINIFRIVFPMGNLLIVLGVITALSGIIFAVLSKDLKLILAYHTISQIGLIIIGIASEDPMSYSGGILHIVNHALFKSLLFLSVGTIAQMYNKRKVYNISGVMKRSPVVGFALLIGILGITGAPFFNGSISKYLIASGYDSGIMVFFLELINLGTILSFVKLSSILFGKSDEKDNAYLNDKVALIISSSTVFLSGVLGFQIHALISGMYVSMSFVSFMGKSLLWVVNVILASVIFRLVLPRFKVYRDGISIDLSFNSMVFNIVLGFLIFFVYGYYVA